MAYYTYILRCEDNSLYTGITTDLARRFVDFHVVDGGEEIVITYSSSETVICQCFYNESYHFSVTGGSTNKLMRLVVLSRILRYNNCTYFDLDSRNL